MESPAVQAIWLTILCQLLVWPIVGGLPRQLGRSCLRSLRRRQRHAGHPDDCPLCWDEKRSAPPEPSSVTLLVEPWVACKSRRGRKKSLDTEDVACPNPECRDANIGDSTVHTIVGDGHRGVTEDVPYWPCQCCQRWFSRRLGTPLYQLKTPVLAQQLAILQRQTKRPRLTVSDRLSLLVFAQITKTWHQVLLIVQPATLLRWHRRGFQLLWKLKSKVGRGRQQISDDTIELIRRMGRENRLWGAERIRGELLKLGIHVAKRTIQRYLREERQEHPASQTWATFLKTHAKDVWSCDFLPVIDVLFRQIYVFFIVGLETRRVVHFGVTRHPSQIWVAQQLREATAHGVKPRFVLRDNDSKYGSAFDTVAKATGIEILRTPYRSPRANAVVERYIGSVRRECLDHLLIFGERQLRRVIAAYVEYFNESRPHQGIDQHVPCGPPTWAEPTSGKIIASPVLNGLHHEYVRHVGAE